MLEQITEKEELNRAFETLLTSLKKKMHSVYHESVAILINWPLEEACHLL
jgi:hypothetical protein